MITAQGGTAPHRLAARHVGVVRPPPPVSAAGSGGAGKGVSSDKAKATILKLRMERMEQLRRQQKGEIKRAGLLCAAAMGAFRKEWTAFKDTFVEQLERTEKTLVSVIAEASPEAHAAVVAHLHPPISSSHPVAKEINALCDSMDSVAKVLQMQWFTFGCFSQGPVPMVGASRRYLDPVVNVATYTQLGTKLKQYVEFASAVNLVNTELRLPNLIQHTSVAVMAANSSYMLKLDRLFDAVRLIRSPFHTHIRTLSLALRIILTVDVCREEMTGMMEKFDRLAKRHTQRCFQYIYHTVSIGRRFAKVLHGAQASKMRRYTEEELERMALDEHAQQVERNVPLTDASNRPCGTCGVPMYCEDCSIKGSHSGELLNLLEERRSLMIAFTARRVEHFSALSVVAEDTLKILKRYKLAAPSANSTKPSRQALALTAAVTEKARMMSDFVFQAERQLRHEGSRRANTLANTSASGDGKDLSISQHQSQHPNIDWSPQHPQSAHTVGGPGQRKSIAAGHSYLHAAKPPPITQLFAEPSPPLIGPFGESVFPTEFYFKHRRAHTAQEERRRIMQQNATVMQEISTGALLPCLTSPSTSPLSSSVPATPARGVVVTARLESASPRIRKEPQYLSARLTTPMHARQH
ncbi:Hypothetical protein, putative [Bodo saltans]|uniref:Uncharacterized protein n=1 Tax=Bodo saltans TaxID=75058 RepID=A0A0S4JCJ9_BODSA|nr:Hypothetical protein, putative [Bodo saltans]|eukprot:CUG86026.1 Hypothetical protein, putative [Bodo saltans]